ncbi:MAG: hypothetical protein KKB50_18715 [Planctomycetes bacterium]|nr:hypothetical protein [Planctomycetota bacterium]
MLGIRHEDKSTWEARVPLTPPDVQRLISTHGVEFCVQSSPARVFPDEQYAAAGAVVAADLAGCPIILGVKEIPPERLEPEKTYIYFAHVIKGQAANMPALRRLLDLKCQLIDYERIVDEQGRRLVFFGRFAGLAGMIDTLWAFGQRLQTEGIDSPFSRIQPAHRYTDLAHAQREIASVGETIQRNGLPGALQPLVCGFAGYGKVALGAQEIYDLLPVEEVAPENLADVPAANMCYKVIFREEHLAERRDPSAPFELQEYYDHPELYQAAFYPHARYLTLLVNCIYWEPKYPRLLTQEQFRDLFAQAGGARLRVVGDITCDVDGSLACTTRATTPDSPLYVYDPVTGRTRDGVSGPGPVVQAVDFLPCELPVDASGYFSNTLSPFVPALARADFTRPLSECGLPLELQRATIVYHGQLTEAYRYLEEHVR